jgi:hypothetical protein
LWLDGDEMISASALVSGGVTIAPASWRLRRMDGREEPPYTHLELDLGTSAAFTTALTSQRSIALTGVYGHSAVEATAGTITAGINASTTTVPVSDSSEIGVGSLLRIDTERVIVTARLMVDTTQNLGGAGLTALNSDVIVPVGSGTSFTVGETILIDAERMLIVDIAGNNLIVKRAWDGTVLAVHATNADVYAPRTLTVTRGALGTTAASHLSAAAVARHVPPALVNELAIAETEVRLSQKQSAYARTIGSGDNERESSGRGLSDIRNDVYTAFGRKMRTASI